MTHPLRRLFAVAALTTALAPAAIAGGMQASVEGPAKDGHTYVVRTYHCMRPSSLGVSAFAEGIVKGERRTLPLALQPTREDGVFTFERSWPRDGRWLVRLDMGGNASLVAAVAANGRVKESQIRWDCDGHQLCDQKLAALVK